jgi:SAM-dependent methyltransferase
MAINTVSKEFFEAKYRDNADPWNFISSSYELNRYALIMEALGSRSFESGFEPGCSIGVLTARLASRCRRLLAMDISPSAVATARSRCAHFPNATIVEGALPGDLPGEILDLIVFSEIGYYFDRDTLAQIRDSLTERLAHQGVLLGVHWLGASADHLLSGDEVHDILRSTNLLRMVSSQRHDGFLLDSWERI